MWERPGWKMGHIWEPSLWPKWAPWPLRIHLSSTLPFFFKPQRSPLFSQLLTSSKKTSWHWEGGGFLWKKRQQQGPALWNLIWIVCLVSHRNDLGLSLVSLTLKWALLLSSLPFLSENLVWTMKSHEQQEQKTIRSLNTILDEPV